MGRPSGPGSPAGALLTIASRAAGCARTARAFGATSWRMNWPSATNSAKRVLRSRFGVLRSAFSTRCQRIMAWTGAASAACRATVSS